MVCLHIKAIWSAADRPHQLEYPSIKYFWTLLKVDVDDTHLSSQCHKKQKPIFLSENIIRINSGTQKRCESSCADESTCSGWFFSLTETSEDPISVCLLLIFNKKAALKVILTPSQNTGGQ